MIGYKLKYLRTEKGLTQKVLSELLQVNHATVSAWEKSKNEPSLEMIVKLAEVFDTTTDYLLGVVNEWSYKISPAPKEISETAGEQFELLCIYNELTPAHKTEIKAIIKTLKDLEKN